jgi:hypothetical protein
MASAQAVAGVPDMVNMTVITDFKTPPLQDSDTFPVTLEVHFNAILPPWIGWAGAIMKLHVLDASEVDVDSFTVADPSLTGVGPFGSDPFGPRSGNLESVPLFFTFWHSQAPNSGIQPPVSAWQNLGLAILHAKNTTPANNSDTDLTAMFWNIWHVRPGFGTLSVALRESDYVFQGDRGQTQVPPVGQWAHVTASGNVHLNGVGSTYYATFANTVRIGVEHVPEPASGLLVAGGVLALALGSRARQRRLRVA